MSSERRNPRVSINKLGEYMSVSAARRRRIIKDQKFPKPFKAARYKLAREAMNHFIKSGADDETIIQDCIADLNLSPSGSSFADQDRDLSVEALDCFLDISDQVSLDGLSVAEEPDLDTRLDIAGVSVSVYPDIIVTQNGRAGKMKVGVRKLYLAKTHPLTLEAGQYVGAILLSYIDEHLSHLGTPDHRLCEVVDVFAGEIIVASKAVKKRRSDVEAACQEIAARWATIKE